MDKYSWRIRRRKCYMCRYISHRWNCFAEFLLCFDAFVDSSLNNITKWYQLNYSISVSLLTFITSLIVYLLYIYYGNTNSLAISMHFISNTHKCTSFSFSVTIRLYEIYYCLIVEPKSYKTVGKLCVCIVNRHMNRWDEQESEYFRSFWEQKFCQILIRNTLWE